MIPPQNLQAEEAVLGAMIVTPSLIPKVAVRLQPEDFFFDTQRMMFREIIAMHNAGAGVDPVTLTGKLKDKVEVGYIHHLLSTTPAAANVSAYAEMVAEASARREWLKLGQQIIEAGGDFPDIERRMNEIRDRVKPPALTVSLREALAEVLKYSQEDGQLPKGMSYPWGKINWLSGGLRPGWLCYLGGDTGAGKTAAALEMAEFTAKAGMKVLVDSLEMSPMELGIRFAQRRGLDSRRFYRGKANEDDRDAIEVCMGLPESGKVEFFRARDVNRMISTVDLIKPDLLIVDYLQLMAIQNGVSREEGTRRNSNDLKNLAGDRQLGILCLSQFKRGEKGRMPTKNDLKDSGAIEQDADQVLLIYRPLDENNRMKDEGFLIGDKFRMGKTGVEEVEFDGVAQTFICKERRYGEPPRREVKSPEPRHEQDKIPF